MKRKRLWLGLFVVAVGACNGDSRPEVFDNGLVSIDESDIRAVISGEDIEIRVPIEAVEPLAGSLRIELTDVTVADGTDAVVASTILNFSQSDELEVHLVTLEGAGTGMTRLDTAAIAIDWRVAVPGGALYGHRSLFDALGNLDVQLRGPTEITESGGSPLRVIVRDPHDSAAIEGAEVTAVLETRNDDDSITTHPLFEGSTDVRGELFDTVTLPEGVTEGDIRVSVRTEDADVWAIHPVSLRVDNQVYLSTDKTIYKPGQDVHLRMLALDGATRMPVANQEVLFEAKDGRGNKVFRRRGRTDEFGVASIVVPIDLRVNEGSWEFSATIDGRASALRIPVERYNLPKMRVTVTSETDYVTPGQTLEGRVHAAYMFGEPVANAFVAVTARSARGRYLGTLSGVTDEEGQYSFEMIVPTSFRGAYDLENAGDPITMTAQLTDTAGQSEAGAGSVMLSAAPLRINFVQDPSSLDGLDEEVGYVIVTDAIGRPVLASLDIAGVTVGRVETLASGVAELRFARNEHSDNLAVTAVDGAGRYHQRSFGLSGNTEDPLALFLDRGVYANGDTALLALAMNEDLERVYVDIYRGATGVLSTEIDVSAREMVVELPISADMSGLLVVDVLGIQRHGGSVRASRSLLVDSDRALNVELASGASEYAPGEEAELTVTARDEAGNPRVASIGLTVVDEAAFVLGGEPAASIGQAFGIDSRALPSELAVGGFDFDDIISVEDSTTRDRLARLLFGTAGSIATPSYNYDSIATEVPAVAQRLGVRVRSDVQSLLSRVSFSSVEAAENYFASVRLADPFGRYYRFNIETGSWAPTLTAVSDGPDEESDTRDDVSVSETIYLSHGGGGGPTAARRTEGEAGDDFAAAPPADEANAAAPQADVDGVADADGASEVRVRADFRETLYVQPSLITDSSGNASMSFPLADSITTWRVSADGSTADGRTGSARHTFRTFQPFFVDTTLPTELTAGDTIEVPAVVYNYTDTAQSVTVAIDEADWFELLSEPVQRIDLEPSEVRAVSFRFLVERAGDQALTIRGSGDGIADALIRTLHVDPAGQPEDISHSGQVSETDTYTVNIPEDTTEGGTYVTVAVTPGFAAEAVQGMESLMREPGGCFEQTTSSAWPNTLVANYLEMTGGMTEENREEIIGMVTRGYQRLLTFESPTGGFNWWGDSDPGNRILSAIMLWHLKDLEPLIETDEAVRDRTLSWLLNQQNTDGSWDAGDALHAGNEVLGTSVARTTSFIAWALAHTGWAEDEVEQAAEFLRGHLPGREDLYANALVANALAMTAPADSSTLSVLDLLDELKVSGERGVHWPTSAPSWTGAGGDAAAIETTGLVAYALMQSESHPDNAAGAMNFIIANKDSVGTWYNTQATMNALRALSALASTTVADPPDGTLTILVNGVVAQTIEVNPENEDLHRTLDISSFVHAGDNQVAVRMSGSGAVNYRLTRRVYRPVLRAPVGPLSLQVNYDRTSVEVGESVQATVVARNNDEVDRNQVMVRVGRAPGFTPRTEDLDLLVASRAISRYEIRSDDVTFYLMAMEAGEARTLRFRLTPSLVVEAVAPASSIYAYYEPELKTMVAATRFEAR